MNLTNEQVKNLNILADFMDGLNDPNFTMSRFINGCGTPACALGWACKAPALAGKGLDLSIVANGGFPTVQLAERVFGTYEEVFSSLGSSGRIETPKEWAAHCRAFLKENGYATTDHFKTFM